MATSLYWLQVVQKYPLSVENSVNVLVHSTAVLAPSCIKWWITGCCFMCISWLQWSSTVSWSHLGSAAFSWLMNAQSSQFFFHWEWEIAIETTLFPHKVTSCKHSSLVFIYCLWNMLIQLTQHDFANLTCKTTTAEQCYVPQLTCSMNLQWMIVATKFWITLNCGCVLSGSCIGLTGEGSQK